MVSQMSSIINDATWLPYADIIWLLVFVGATVFWILWPAWGGWKKSNAAREANGPRSDNKDGSRCRGV